MAAGRSNPPVSAGNPSRYYAGRNEAAPEQQPLEREEDHHHHNNVMAPVKWTSKLSVRSSQQKMASYSIGLGMLPPSAASFLSA